MLRDDGTIIDIGTPATRKFEFNYTTEEIAERIKNKDFTILEICSKEKDGTYYFLELFRDSIEGLYRFDMVKQVGLDETDADIIDTRKVTFDRMYVLEETDTAILETVVRCMLLNCVLKEGL